MDLKDYYGDRHVRARMIEFLGGSWPESVGALFVTQCDYPSVELGQDLRPVSDLDYYLSNQLDISRSFWDRHSLIIHLDVEYVNHDFPAEPYLDPARTFELQRPAEAAIERTLLELGIAPLHVLSGRGHHFVWRIRRDSTAFGKLVELGHVPDHLAKRYAVAHPPVQVPIDRELAAAFSGLGLVMEYVALMVRDLAGPDTPIPVEITAIEAPPQQRGREIVSIDITEYGDLLNTRLIRIPFSLYLKPWQRAGVLNDEIRARLRTLVSVPLFEMSTQEGVETMRDLDRAAELAARASAQIPDQSRQTVNLIRRYESSEVAVFHDWFYSEEHEPPELWPRTYDQAPIDQLTPCARSILNHPNDRLLKPSGIRHIVRVMMAIGWHPRHVAGLIRSKFERDYGWGREWYFYDAALRADFYTRLFACQIKTGRDTLDDFDGQPLRGMECLPRDGESPSRLDDFKQSLLERVKHERLASRPFNGLFLPDKHL